MKQKAMKRVKMTSKLLLFPISVIYSTLYWLNVFLYKLGLRKIYEFKVPVISIGNITVGGTGKTPVTKTIVKYFLDRGLKPGIVSRGYKRQSNSTVRVCDGTTILASIKESGDEPYLLAQMLGMQVPIVVSNNKACAIDIIQNEYSVDVVVIDDGFQSLSIKRDIDIVLINRSEPSESYWMLPMGRMREPISSLSRSQFVALTKDGSVHRFIDEAIHQAGIQVLRTSTSTCLTKTTSDGCLEKISSNVEGSSVIAFCGLGDPRSFGRSLSELNLTIKQLLTFADHHHYVDKDIVKIKQEIEDHQSIDFIVTTEKDYYKLPPSFLDQHNVHVLKYEITIDKQDLEDIRSSIGL